LNIPTCQTLRISLRIPPITSPSVFKDPVGVCAMAWHPSLRFAAMPEYYQKPASLCNLFHENKTIEQMIAIVKINRP